MSGPNDVEVNVQNEEQQPRAAVGGQSGKLCGFPAKYVTAAVGALTVILIIVALGVDAMWTFDNPRYDPRWDTPYPGWGYGRGKVTVGWKEQCFDGGGCWANQGDTKSRGSAWLAMGLLCFFATLAATVWCGVASFVDQYVTFMSERTKQMLAPIGFAVSAILLFIGSMAVVTYSGPQPFSYDVGASPILGFVIIPFLIACTVLAYKYMRQ